MVHLHCLLTGSNLGVDIPSDIFCKVLDHFFDHIEEYDIPFDDHYFYVLSSLRDTLAQEPKKDLL